MGELEQAMKQLLWQIIEDNFFFRANVDIQLGSIEPVIRNLLRESLSLEVSFKLF